MQEPCPVCYDDINEETALEYATEEGLWYPCMFCADCVEEIRQSQFYRYCESVKSSNCAREQRKLLERGPPIRLFDRIGFPEAGDSEIFALRKRQDQAVLNSLLEGCLQGQERLDYWQELKGFIILDEKVEEEAS